MSDHDEMRALLGLAASGDLEAAEQRRVDAHVAACKGCAAELAHWRGLVGELHRLPTVQPSAALLRRVRASATAELAGQVESWWSQAAVACAVLAAWPVAVASWPAVRWLGSLLVRVEWGWGWWLAVSASLAWLLAGVAGCAMALRWKQEGRNV